MYVSELSELLNCEYDLLNLLLYAQNGLTNFALLFGYQTMNMCLSINTLQYQLARDAL